jgi:hypothetical protein
VLGFVATKNEVLQLVRYWATEIIRLEFTCFLYAYSGSSEWRTREFANRRLDTIGKLIGQEEVTNAYRQAEQAYGRVVDPQAWGIFMEGTPEEQARFQQEGQESLERAAEEGCTWVPIRSSYDEIIRRLDSYKSQKQSH